MREGAIEAERPKLGRPKAQTTNTHVTSENVPDLAIKSRHETKSDAKRLATGRGEVSPTTDQNKSELTHSSNQPITTPERRARIQNQKGQTRKRPITSSSAGNGDERAKIQTYDTLSGKPPHPGYLAKGPLITEKMLDQWTSDMNNKTEHNSNRPLRSTRNANPQYKT